MKILYKTSQVEKLCNDEKKAIRELGIDVANRLFAALNALESANNLYDILVLPQYNLHILKGKLEGLYSMYLGKTTGYRLILTSLDENENAIKCNDMSIYTISVCVEIKEVSKHYE